MSETMGQIIRRLRKERNLTQEELAQQLNVTFQAISRWENETGMPDISQIVPLSNVFGVTTDVLFGKNGTDGDEVIASFIKDAEKKICNLPQGISSFAWQKECCEDVQRMLEVYPNNYELLSYSLGHIDGLLDEYTEIEDYENKSTEIQKWQNELIRQANVILSHCSDIKYLNNAHKWLAELYVDTGNLEKAEEHAKKLAEFSVYNDGGSYIAYVLSRMGRTDDAMNKRADNIYKALDYLKFELTSLAGNYKNQGKLEEAYVCYRLYPDIYDIMVGNRDDEMPFYGFYSYDYCAEVCVQLGRYDEAMDWLEKMVRHEKIRAKNHNVITETKLPYFYGRELHYCAKTYDRTDAITPTLAWKVFDPIRDTDRFKAILSDAEAFEKGE